MLMPRPGSEKISFEQFGDLLQKAYDQGLIGDDVSQMIAAGLLPLEHLRQQLRWIIERDGDGLRISLDD